MRLSWRPLVLISAAAVLLVTLGWLLGLPELAALAVGGWATAAASAVWLALRQRGPTLEMVLHPSAVTRGDPVTLEMRFHGPSDDAEGASVAARFTGRLGPAGTGILAVTPLAPHERSTVSVQLATPERGLLHVDPLQCTVTDPLGWWRLVHDTGSSATVVVRPQVHHLGRHVTAGGSQPSAVSRTRQVGARDDVEEELVGLRPYVRGDDLRRIHWRTSARRNEPHVVQVEPPVRSPSIVVVLDTTSPCDAPGFERAVEAAASLLSHGAAAGRPIQLVTPSGWDSAQCGPRELTTLLDLLAVVDRQDGGDLADALRRATDGEATVAICTGSHDLTRHGEGAPDIVVACGDRSLDPGIAVPPAAPSISDVTVVHWDGSRSLAEEWAAAVPTTDLVGVHDGGPR